MTCLVCGAAADIGELCRGCAQEVPPCDGLIGDHVRSTVESTEAVAWVVDGFGNSHALAAKTTIGRSHDGELVILAASVSREHAELKQVDDKWFARDLGSRNGTFVDGTRCQGRVALPLRARVTIGDVALWFLGEVAHAPQAAPSLVTGSAAGALVRFSIAAGAGELCLVGGSDAATGGSLLSRATAEAAWGETSLSPLEFQLLRALCERAVAEAESLSTVRGCVSTPQLVRDLPWQSKYANEENVRQVVRRLRQSLAALGVDGVLAVAPGRGYYLARPVTTAAASRG